MRSGILGVVLAGGGAKRFGGDKALALLDGRPLIQWAIGTLAGLTDEVVIAGRTVEGHVGLADRPEADMGPLGGLNAALHHGRDQGYEAVLTTGCDTPVLPAELAERLIGEGAAVVTGHHLIGFWPTTLADRLDAHLRDGTDRSIRGWIAEVGPRQVAPESPLPNINTREDLAALTHRLSDGGD